MKVAMITSIGIQDPRQLCLAAQAELLIAEEATVGVLAAHIKLGLNKPLVIFPGACPVEPGADLERKLESIGFPGPHEYVRNWKNSGGYDRPRTRNIPGADWYRNGAEAKFDAALGKAYYAVREAAELIG